jgi:hypothetical protein
MILRVKPSLCADMATALKFLAGLTMYSRMANQLLLDRAIALTIKAFEAHRTTWERAELLQEALELTRLIAPE